MLCTKHRSGSNEVDGYHQVDARLLTFHIRAVSSNAAARVDSSTASALVESAFPNGLGYVPVKNTTHNRDAFCSAPSANILLPRLTDTLTPCVNASATRVRSPKSAPRLSRTVCEGGGSFVDPQL